jgi:hypothetical protein
MVRENFTFQEHEAVVADILKSMEWFELPQVCCRPAGGVDGRVPLCYARLRRDSEKWFDGAHPCLACSQLIYQMGDQGRMRFMKTAGIPSLIIALVIKKQIRRFQKEIMDPFVAIGQVVPPRVAASA